MTATVRRIISNFLATLLTFALGYGITFWYRGVVPENVGTQNDSQNELAHKTELKATRTYSVGATGQAVNPRSGTQSCFGSIFTSDGMAFSHWAEYHDSSRAARKALKEALRKSTAIVERKHVLDQEGRQVGEQVVATFPDKYPHFGAASLLWTNGSTFRYVTSSSLENIIEYEKDPAQRHTR